MNIKDTTYNSPNWLHWLDPLTQVNQNSKPSLLAKLKFETISFKSKRNEIIAKLNEQIKEKKKYNQNNFL